MFKFLKTKKNKIEDLEIKINRLREQISYFDNMTQSKRVIFERRQYEDELEQTELELINTRSESLGIIDRGMRIRKFARISWLKISGLLFFAVGVLNASMGLLGTYGDDPVVKLLLLVLPILTFMTIKREKE